MSTLQVCVNKRVRESVCKPYVLLDCVSTVQVCVNFQDWPGRFTLVAQKYGYRTVDARRRLADMTWSCFNHIDDEVRR